MTLDQALTWASAHPYAMSAAAYVAAPIVAVLLRRLSARFSVVAEVLEASGFDAAKAGEAVRRAIAPNR